MLLTHTFKYHTFNNNSDFASVFLWFTLRMTNLLGKKNKTIKTKNRKNVQPEYSQPQSYYWTYTTDIALNTKVLKVYEPQKSQV